MPKSIITNSQLLDFIETKKLNAGQICEKAEFGIGTLRRRHHVLMMNEQRFINVDGLFDPDNVVEQKKGGITISMKKLDALKNPHEIGTKFMIEVNHKTKKIILTPQG
jgi:hypothetical protein